jgi:hypothetical protein
MTSGLVVLGLGFNAWLTHVLFVLLSAETRAMQYVVGASALVCLALGVGARVWEDRLPGRQVASRWLLLCIYPTSLALALALEQARETAHSYLSMPLCAASLLAYCIAAAVALREPLTPLVSESHPISSRRQGPPAPRTLRAAVIVIVLLGAFAIAVVAPLWPPYSEVTRGWGDAAAAGATLGALVATATAVSVIAIHLGTILRRAEPRVEPVRVRRNRIATLVFLALLGFVTYVTVAP